MNRRTIFFVTQDGFVRREVEGIVFYACRALEEMAFVRHGFSTRHGGVSPLPADALNLSHVSWDSSQRVEENRARFLKALNLSSSSLATVSQIHSDRVLIIEETNLPWNCRFQADAIATQHERVAVAVQTADCFPVLLVDRKTRAVASVHAGWRGTLARIVSKTVEVMRTAFDCDPARLVVAVGPGIRSCCFEVGAEVATAFEREFPRAVLSEPHSLHPGKYLLDLPRALEVQFEQLGLSKSQVFDLGLCTRCSLDEFFSYRGEGPKSGRMMAVIARVPD